MSDDPAAPYRAMTPHPPSELERLAAEGQRKHDALARGSVSQATSDGEYNFAVAVGGHFGTPWKRAIAVVHYALIGALVTLIVLLATSVAGMDKVGPLLPIAGIGSFLLIFVRIFVPPYASKAQREGEVRWATSLPFSFEGYPDIVRLEPSVYVRITVFVTWAGHARGPDANTLLGVIRVSDPTADHFEMTRHGCQWVSGKIEGDTGIMVNRQPVYRNHRVVKYVHDLVEQTLMPLHRNSALEKVTLTSR
jgi:hypothetical protein